jgi:hypothetical protein
MAYSPFAPTSHSPGASTRPPPLRNEGKDTIVQGDTNGDGKADFSIDLVGVTGEVHGSILM